ncbi:IMPACT family protein [Microbacterium murale]|uniref:IMPACT family protein n=1 Tax=Microbacterium murale TaxID=1081040 RepID=UPI0027D7FD1F|nr:YigZ family protein [Microbacterium murale]
MIKKSRFIAHAEPVASAEDADRVIAAVKHEAWGARHNCSAQVTGALGDQARSSDDGEPSGTAGVPMLEVLLRRELTDVVVVVTRYFGGVKLGAGGLVRAYSSAVSEALELATIVDRRMLSSVAVTVEHADAGRYDNLLREWVRTRGALLGDPVYRAKAEFVVWAPPSELPALSAELAAASSGSVRPVLTGAEKLVGIPRHSSRD